MEDEHTVVTSKWVQSPVSPDEWTRAFDEFEAVATAHPPAEDLGEETAQALIDEVSSF